eukprot:TCALIF_04355-PA protein Name:"Protein of unknown function" AED:0.40 eAED:0.40 QI:0/0/0/0.33/0/0.33/3/0/125
MREPWWEPGTWDVLVVVVREKEKEDVEVMVVVDVKGIESVASLEVAEAEDGQRLFEFNHDYLRQRGQKRESPISLSFALPRIRKRLLCFEKSAKKRATLRYVQTQKPQHVSTTCIRSIPPLLRTD